MSLCPLAHLNIFGSLGKVLQKVIVTGGAGFIGSHLVDALIGDDVDVLVFDNLTTGKLENLSPDAISVSYTHLRAHET